MTNSFDLEYIKKEIPSNLDNIENILDIINDTILKNVNEYKYKNLNLEKINYELYLEISKIKYNKIYNKLNNLPSELFHNILSFIDFNSLLECRLVNKNWYNKISLLSHLYINLKLKENKDILIYWKNFCRKKIPSKTIIFCDSNDNHKDFFNELIENDNFLGILFYIDTKNGQGIYANKNDKKMKIFGDIDIIYEHIYFFKPTEIIISETSINRNKFEEIINYCKRLKNNNLNIIFDNSITFLCINKYIEWYNFKYPHMFNIEIKNTNIINENKEICYKLKIDINYMIMEEFVMFEKVQCLIEIYISEKFKFIYKQKDDVMKKINEYCY